MERLQAVEISHWTADVQQRERLVRRLGRLGIDDRLAALDGEHLVLATCGRFEVYAYCDAPLGCVLRDINGKRELPTRTYAGTTAVEHALRVAAGLESPLLGEDQILGQWRRAFLTAQRNGTTGPVLNSLFQVALHTGRRARHAGGLRQAATSYARLAAQAACAHLARPRRVAILGSGSLAADIARRLAPLCREQLFIVSRHHERAHDLAVSVGGSWACYADLPQVLKASDVVVACTTAQRPVLHLTNLPCDEQARTVIDLGMPRNVAGDASARANVRLLTLGDFIDRPPLSALDQARLTQVLEHGQRRFERWFEVHRALRAAQMSEAAA